MTLLASKFCQKRHFWTAGITGMSGTGCVSYYFPRQLFSVSAGAKYLKPCAVSVAIYKCFTLLRLLYLLFCPCLAIAVWSCIRSRTSCKVLGAQVAGERGRRTKIARSNISLKCYAGKAGTTFKSGIINMGNAVG